MRHSDSYPVPVQPQEIIDWQQSWRDSCRYDCLEVWKNAHTITAANTGYVYSYSNRRKHTLEQVWRSARPPARVLDLAAVRDNFAITLAGLGCKVIWNDLQLDK